MNNKKRCSGGQCSDCSSCNSNRSNSDRSNRYQGSTQYSNGNKNNNHNNSDGWFRWLLIFGGIAAALAAGYYLLQNMRQKSVIDQPPTMDLTPAQVKELENMPPLTEKEIKELENMPPLTEEEKKELEQELTKLFQGLEKNNVETGGQ